jgi:histidinol-phosphatase (PHP family)
MKKAALPDYFKEIAHASEKYGDQIQIHKSLEIDYVPGQIYPGHEDLKAYKLDYTIGSIHHAGIFENGTPWEIDGTHTVFRSGLEQIFHNDIQQAIENYFSLTREMVRLHCPDVTGHLDKIKMQNQSDCSWDETAPWYREAVFSTLEEIRSSGTIVEINTRGMYKKIATEPYPSIQIIKEMYLMGIPVCLNSDAHVPAEITGSFGEAVTILKETGYKSLKVFLDGQWQDAGFNENGLML